MGCFCIVRIRFSPCPRNVVYELTLTPPNPHTQSPKSFKTGRNNPGTMAQPIPQALAYLIKLNVEFCTLICLQCQYAQRPTYICRHLGDRHKVPIELRKQVEEYTKGCPFKYDYTSIQLPSDGSAPQPIIPVLNKYKYKGCQFKTHGRDIARQHCNKDYNQKKIADEDMFELVKLQC
ncbi:hypothetical protein BKA61DRAFT_623673 [Leptodontidium sp. MPI-SDFR-AT-0119]|nr:hypothetical protein BKA61DRAFT_623673 [Leptodontidium sp. MPI-SDFR-AT-0119]